MKLLCFVTLCFLLIVSSLASKSNVVRLTKDNFSSTVFTSDHLWLVEFYAPWCGHCKALAPEWEKAATNLKNLVKVGAVDCDVEKELCGLYEIRGFPTIKVFPAKRVDNPHQKGAPYKKPEDYQGARQAASIVNYALSLQPSFVTSVSSKNEEDFLTKNKGLSKVILFTNKDKTTSLYKGLSSEFYGRLALAEVKHTDSGLVKKYGVSEFPSLFVLPKDSEEPVKFDGKLQWDALADFFKKYASPKAEPEKPKAEKPKKKEKEEEAEVVVTVPRVQDQDTFTKTCNKLCVVSFFSEENTGADDHKRYVDAILKVAKKNHKLFQFLWIDGVEQINFMEHFHLASGFPELIVYSPAKSSYVPFVGSFEEKTINEFLEQVMRGTRKASSIKEPPALVSATAQPTTATTTEETKKKDEL